MSFDDALRRFRANNFTDDDIVRCAGLTVRAWRELIKLRAVRTETVPRGRGRVRQCDAVTLKRAAIIAALNQSGFNLSVSGQIGFFIPFHTVLFSLCDPNTILSQRFMNPDGPSRVQEPKVDWFDPKKPAKAEPETDWLIHIYETRFVAVSYGGTTEPTLFGDLRNEGGNFVSWLPLRRLSRLNGTVTEELARQLLPTNFIKFVEEGQDPRKFPRELRLLDYNYENNPDGSPLRLTAEATARSPVFTTTINVSLAIRKALRRYLEIDPAANSSSGSVP
jgi:hypothetical protein